MIKSMTGFGRSEILKNNRKIVIEVKSVNHRYLEAGIKMPKKLNSFESRIRETLKKYANRGKVDIFINYEDNNETQVNLKYNDKLAKEYMDIFAKMADEFKIENDINVSALSRYPEVISMEDAEVDEEELWAFIEEALKESLEKFVETRVLEGEHLKNDLLLKLDHMENLLIL